MNGRDRMTRLTVAALVIGLCTACRASPEPAVVPAVRAAVAQGDFAGGERIVSAYRAAHGVTPEMLEALSWLGRGALAAGQWTAARNYARQTYDLSTAEIEVRPLDREPHLPIALGAAIEVLAHVMTEEGARTEAIGFLGREVEAHRGSSVEKRIWKNIHLLSLEGKPAPPIDIVDHLGPEPVSLEQLKGRIVVLFFWAHWCADCKAQAPALEAVAARYRDQGVTVVAPTQRFGYVAGGRTAAADEETRYIEQIRQTYPGLAGVSVPLSAATHTRYGVSSTPTLVVVDSEGIVRLYHPGRISEPDLEMHISRLLIQRTP